MGIGDYRSDRGWDECQALVFLQGCLQSFYPLHRFFISVFGGVFFFQSAKNFPMKGVFLSVAPVSLRLFKSRSAKCFQEKKRLTVADSSSPRRGSLHQCIVRATQARGTMRCRLAPPPPRAHTHSHGRFGDRVIRVLGVSTPRATLSDRLESPSRLVCTKAPLSTFCLPSLQAIRSMVSSLMDIPVFSLCLCVCLRGFRSWSS